MFICHSVRNCFFFYWYGATRLTQQEEKITAQEQEIKELREREEQREKQIQEILSKLEMIEKAKA